MKNRYLITKILSIMLVCTVLVGHCTGCAKTEVMEAEIEETEEVSSQISITKIAEYDSGVINPDGGSSEIVQYNADTHMYYAVNGTTGTLDIIPREANKGTEIKYDLKGELAKVENDFEYGDMTSVAVNENSDLIAVAVQAADTTENGRIVFMNYNNEIISTIEVGVQPDNVIFTEDGGKVLSANEGEPRNGYGEEIDPEGTISIIDLENGVDSAIVTEVTFEEFDSEEARNKLIEDGIIIKKETNPSNDFEPEYITINGERAYVSLQEANAIAVIDIEDARIISINSLGFKDHNIEVNALDLADDGKVNIKTENVYGIYMPDAISSFTKDGKTYLVTANEGDSREWGDEESEQFHCNEKKITDINGEKVTVFDTSEYDGLEMDQTYIFGGRSFSIYEVNLDGTMYQVFDSGSDFERITAERLPEYFNCSNDDIELDSRSGKKGPEAEGVVIGKVNDKMYAFIGIERIGGIMIYDITDPENTSFVHYINSRDFTTDIAGDVSPEGIDYVSSTESVSGNAEIIVSHEVSGTVAIYEIKE